MKKRSYKISAGGFSATLTYFSEQGDPRREPLGEIFDKINNVHRHSEHEAFFVIGGEIELVFENGLSRFSNSVVIVPAGMDHYTAVDSEKLFVVYFSAENEETERLFASSLSDVYAFDVGDEERFYVDRIGNMKSEDDDHHVLSLLFSSLVARLAPESEGLKNKMSSDTGKYTLDIDAFIDKRYSEQIRLSELARHLHLCEKQVSRVIKKEYNCSFPELVERKRLSVAAMMLKYTDRTVCRVSRSVGFENDNYFYRVFKENYGETPSEYRTRHKSG